MMKFTMNAKDLKVMMEKGMAAINKKANGNPHLKHSRKYLKVYGNIAVIVSEVKI